MFSIFVSHPESTLGLKINLDCTGECMVVDIQEDTFNVKEVNYISQVS